MCIVKNLGSVQYKLNKGLNYKIIFIYGNKRIKKIRW